MQRRRRHVGQDLAVEPVEDAQLAARGDGADHRGDDLPPLADGEDRVEVAGLDDGQHALLALAGHDLERRHARLALGHLGHVDVHPDPAAAGRLAGGAGEPGPAQVLDPDHQAGVEHLEARLDEALLLERVAHLHAGSLGRVVLVLAEAGGRQHRHATDAVASRGRPEEDREVADTRRPAEHQPLDGEDAEAENVHQRVVLIRLVEDRLTPDGRHPDRVAITADAGHHTLGDPAAARVGQWPEPQGIHQSDGTGTHGEHIAEDAADARGRALVRLDGRRVVVALDAEGHADAVTGIDHTRVLARSDEDGRPFGGQTPQMNAAGLVRTVLRPHHCVHGQFEVVGLAAQDAGDGRRFVVGQPEGSVDLLVGGHAQRLGPVRAWRRNTPPRRLRQAK